MIIDQKILTPDVERFSLKLWSCEDLEWLADTTKENVPTCVMFNNLVELVMGNMIGFKMLCNGQPPDRWFPTKLRNFDSGILLGYRLFTSRGTKLKKFRIDQAPVLSNLESLKLDSVPELRWIFKGHPTPTQNVSLSNLKDVSFMVATNWNLFSHSPL